MAREKKNFYGWHFLPDNRRLRYGDSRHVDEGETLEMTSTVHDSPIICRAGMHASEDVFDAIKYAPGFVLCRVLVTGDVQSYFDKFCGRNRKVLWMVDCRDALIDAFIAANYSIMQRSNISKDSIVGKCMVHARKLARDMKGGAPTGHTEEWSGFFDDAYNKIQPEAGGLHHRKEQLIIDLKNALEALNKNSKTLAYVRNFILQVDVDERAAIMDKFIDDSKDKRRSMGNVPRCLRK